jgi:hypothetical protein
MNEAWMADPYRDMAIAQSIAVGRIAKVDEIALSIM